MLVFGDGRGLPLILFPTSFGRYYAEQRFRMSSMPSPLHRWRSESRFIVPTRSISTAFTTRRFIRPIGCGHTTLMKMSSCAMCSISRDAKDHVIASAVCGASLGAYHALNIAFRHPDAVSHLISMSGAFDISDFFNGYYDDNIYFNSPYDYIPNMPDPWKFNHMSIIIGTGEWDNTRHESLRMSGILNCKGNQPLARRSEMVWPRLELLARHAAGLFVEAVNWRSGF